MLDVTTHGDPARPHLVLLHSGGMTRREWDPFLSAWSGDFHLIAMTAVGHGQSPPAESLSVDDLVASTVRTLDRLGITRTHLLGSSLGGVTALHLALRHPQRVDRLVLYRSGFRSSPAVRASLARFATAETWQRWGLAAWIAREHEAQGGAEAWLDVVRRVAALFDQPETSLASTDLARVAAPVLIIAGDRDNLVPAEDLLAMYRGFPRAALWIVPGAGHLLGMETWRRAAFQEEIRRFLTRPAAVPETST